MATITSSGNKKNAENVPAVSFSFLIFTKEIFKIIYDYFVQ